MENEKKMENEMETGIIGFIAGAKAIAWVIIAMVAVMNLAG